MTDSETTVFLVDDDPSVLRGLERLLRAAGLAVRGFTSPEAFLEQHDPAAPGCAVLDLAMSGLSGLELQRALAARGGDRPVIFLTGRGDIAASVQAMKAGATDFLTKPVAAEDLVTAVRLGIEKDRQARAARAGLEAIERRLATLTAREHEVLRQVVAGRLNKQIAAELGTAEKTVKVHRGRMMAKMGIRSVAELVRMTADIGIAGDRAGPPDGTKV
jgi:FixJ family two-component response regulator